MNDRYRELVEALRPVVEAEDHGDATRRRILQGLAAPRRAQHARWVLALVAASLVLSSAFALYRATHTERPPASLARPVAAPAPTAEPAPIGDVATQAALPPSRNEAAPRRASHAQRIPTRAPASTVATDAATAAPQHSAPSARDDAANSAIARGDVARVKALFITAHRLQFRGHPQHALEAWDAYLASAPTGPLVREALYNRAVILVRLGRRAEAERALAPFARGEHGGFRQHDAQQLSRTLNEH